MLDYARFGRMLLNLGELDGKRIIIIIIITTTTTTTTIVSIPMNHIILLIL